MKKVFSFFVIFSILVFGSLYPAASSPIESINKSGEEIDQQTFKKIDLRNIKFSDDDKKKIMELAILFGKKHKENIRNNLKKILGELYYKEIPDKMILNTQIGHLETAEEIAKKLILLGIQIRNAEKNNKTKINNAAEIETFCYRAAFLHYKKFFNENLDRFNLGKKFTLMLDMVICLKYAMHSAPDVDEKIRYKNAAIKSLQDILVNLAFHEHKYFSKLFIIYLDDMQAIAKNTDRKRIKNVATIKEQIDSLIAKIKSYDPHDSQ